MTTPQATRNRTTLQEVADLCKLSRSTVSRVLNGNAGNFRIAQKTIDQVTAAAEQLNYRPNRLARAIMNRRTHLISLSMPMFADYDHALEREIEHSHWLTGVLSHAITQHPQCSGKYDLVLHNRDERSDDILRDGISQDLLDGIIYVTPSEKHQEFIKHINQDIPIVLMGDMKELHDSVICVDINNRKMAKKATEHLLSTGRKNIMPLIPESVLSAFCIQDRLEGFRDALREAGIAENPDLTRIMRADKKLISDLILNSPTLEHVDAMLCLTGSMATLCVEPLKQRGLRVPEDIALLAVDSMNPLSETEQKITSIDLPFKAIARAAVELLLDVLEDRKPYQPGFHEVPAELSIRESTVKS